MDRSDFAWLVAVPAALVTVAAMAVLGAPLGHAVIPVRTLDFWPDALPFADPKPAEQARYLIALGGALLVPIAIFAWDPRRLPSRFARAGALAVQVAFAAVLLAAVLTKRLEEELQGHVQLGVGYFTARSIVVAVLFGVAFAICLWSPTIRGRIRGLLVLDSRAIRLGSAALAALATAIWLLPAIQLDGTVSATSGSGINLAFTFDEGLAVLNGHTPLVDYVAQYGSLWLFPVAIPLDLANGSLGSFTAAMAAISAIAMLAVYGVLRRVTRSAIGALALFLPFLATSFFIIGGSPVDRYSFADYFGVFPLRYAGPYLVSYLVARHLSGARPRTTFWIFLGAGLAVLNNVDFGVPALGASLVALVVGAAGPRTREWSLRLAAELVGGLAAAYALVSILTLVRAGEMPDLALLVRYARLFAVAGYGMLPTPWFGLWVAIYLTFAAALAVAALMVVRRSEERTLAGMLAWIGIFGLGIGSYYDGRSHQQVLISMFSSWALAMALLVVVAVRSSPASRRHSGPAQVALFVGFGLAVCSLGQLPTPWGSIDRLQTASGEEALQRRPEARFVAAHSRPGDPVALLASLGQRIAREAGVEDVTPYTGSQSMPTRQQLRETLDRLRAAGGSQVVLRESETWPDIVAALKRQGFRIEAREPAGEQGKAENERLALLARPSG